MIYANPGAQGSVVSFKERYGNFISGEFVAPVKGQYFTNISPVTGGAVCEIPRSTVDDIEKALDAAHAAKAAWDKTSVQARGNILLQIADRIEQNLEKLAVTETWDNGKAVRETLNADIPLAADHFRYFAGCIRAQEGTLRVDMFGATVGHSSTPASAGPDGVLRRGSQGEFNRSITTRLASISALPRAANWLPTGLMVNSG
jgi:hypothetical protein